MERQTTEIEGMDSILNAMNELPAIVQQKIIRKVLFRAGRRFIVNELRTALSYSPRLKKSLGVVNSRYDKSMVVAGVMVKGRINNAVPPGVIVRWVDLGTKRRTTKKGYNRGAIDGKNEVQPNINKNIPPMTKWIQDEMAKEIDIELDRLLKKYK
jgi:hypothetical protein